MYKGTYHFFFKNLANPLKVSIIERLKKEKKNVTELSHDLSVEQSKISHALSSLRNCNIVEVKQKGKQRIYSLNKKTMLPMLKLIDNHSKTFCKSECAICGGCRG